MFDQDARDDPGGQIRAALSRVFENVDNPSGWSLPLLTVLGVRWRVHIVTIGAVVVAMVSSIVPDHLGVMFVAMLVGAFAVAVVAHELGHAIACRLSGGRMDRAVLLPWGGLTLWEAPDRTRSEVIAAVGGVGANVVLIGLSAIGLVATGYGAALQLVPVDFSAGFVDASDPGRPARHAARLALWSLYAANTAVAFVNLVPAFPFDGASALRAMLRRQIGWSEATAWTASLGLLVGAIGAAAALAIGSSIGVLLACLAITASWVERRRPGALEIVAGGDELADLAAGHDAADAEADRLELDTLLAKISERGMKSLTRSERRRLDQLRERAG
ncbi:MAG: site-2 protease family protein [Planctomycetota bacterium]